jgi:4a-hydroxytetrahydrobiopterin dehydratase
MAKSRDELLSLKCVPCQGGIPPMKQKGVQEMLRVVPEWTKAEDEYDKIERTFKFKNFKKAIEFVNDVADVAEEEGHHPDIFISWNKVTLTLWTHAIKGLHENDFILAAKIDDLL